MAQLGDIKQGQYMFPYCKSPDEMKDPDRVKLLFCHIVCTSAGRFNGRKNDEYESKVFTPASF
jgi:hypothetical protein